MSDVPLSFPFYPVRRSRRLLDMSTSVKEDEKSPDVGRAGVAQRVIELCRDVRQRAWSDGEVAELTRALVSGCALCVFVVDRVQTAYVVYDPFLDESAVWHALCCSWRCLTAVLVSTPFVANPAIERVAALLRPHVCRHLQCHVTAARATVLDGWSCDTPFDAVLRALNAGSVSDTSGAHGELTVGGWTVMEFCNAGPGPVPPTVGSTRRGRRGTGSSEIEKHESRKARAKDHADAWGTVLVTDVIMTGDDRVRGCLPF